MGELLNLVGLSMGIALYAMLLAMVIRTGRTRSDGAGIDPLLLSTALLGLTWNVCALPVYELLKIGMTGPFRLFTAIGFSALGLLPAVAVHSVLRRDRDHLRDRLSSGLVLAAYGLGAVAALLQFRALALGDPLPSSVGMQLLTYGFLVLVLPLAFLTRGQQGPRRALWVAALSIFAVSSLHLSQFHQGEPSLAVELLGHHASLPLAVAILYQDFPFALADLFLKRTLTLLVVVAVPFLTLGLLGGLPGDASRAVLPDGLRSGLFVSVWVGTTLLYPSLQRLSAWFVDTVVLRRPDYGALRADIGATVGRADRVPTLLDEVCAKLGPALNARTVRWTERIVPDGSSEGDAGTDARFRTALAGDHPDRAIVDIPVAETPGYVIDINGLTGGRRLLSDDRAFLDAVVGLVGRRVDAIRISRERYEREIREQEMAKLATEAELRALRAQINPHFLFNALTTIGYLIQTSPGRAFDTLMRLTALLRGVLRGEGEFTTLGRELELIRSYLDIESARFEERLRVTIRVPESLCDLRMPALLLQPLVENAVKHGIAPERHGGDLLIDAHLEERGSRSDLLLTVRDSGAGVSDADLRRGREHGVGLRNIERRLSVQYGVDGALTIRSAPGVGTTAILRIPAEMSDTRETAVTRSVH
ncbi:MAG: sensor histidine kinase [Vicinamibacterales bacterium]